MFASVPTRGSTPPRWPQFSDVFNVRTPRAAIEFVVDHTAELVDHVDAGTLDIALIQVDEASRHPDDITLGEDDLVWASSRTATFDKGVTPLVTFGECCFYRPLSEPMLREAGFEHTVAISVQSSLGVRAAIEAGLGVGVIGRRHVYDDVIEWP